MPIEWTDTYAGWEQHYRIEDDGTVTEAMFMDAEPVLERAKAEHNAGVGVSPSGEWRKVASIPWGLVRHWRVVDGVDVLKPGNDGWLRKKLDDPELTHLRVWKGHLGKYHE